LSAFHRTCALLVACGLAGCAAQGRVHPDYARLAPSTILVPTVKNETIHQLDDVSIGGLLQRALIGPKTVDVLDLVQGSAEEALVLKGYATWGSWTEPPGEKLDFRRPLPAGAPALSFDAVCMVTIEEWSVDAISGSSLHMVYRIELYKVPSAELLYFGQFGCGYREDIRDPRVDDFTIMIRRSVRDAFSDLPSRGE